MHIKNIVFPLLISILVLAASGCLQSKAEKDYPRILSPEEGFIGIVHDAGTTNNVKYDWWFAGNYIGTTKSGDAFSNFGQALVKTKLYWNSSIPEGTYFVESRHNYNDELNEKTAIMVVSDKIEVESGTASARILVTDKYDSKENKADVYVGENFVTTVNREFTKKYQPIFEYNIDTSVFPGKGNYEIRVIGNESRKEVGKRTVIVR